MWQVTNRTPFSTMGYFVRDAQGVEHWVVAMRATFQFDVNGEVRVADAQLPVQMVPVPHAEDAAQLVAESDFQPFRPQVDISIHGTAHAPTGTPVTAFPAILRVGQLEKSLICHGPRILRKRQGKFLPPDEGLITMLPLDWRYALGGVCMADDNQMQHPANPVGMGWVSDWSLLPDGAELALPQMTAGQADILPGRTLPAPQGFGVLPPQWEPRLRYAGTYDDAWRATRHPRLPVDFDPRFHQAVLPDQWANLVGGEQVELVNMHESGDLRFRLPQMIVAAHTEIGMDHHNHRLRVVAVDVDTRTQTVSMVYNGAVPCNGRDTDVKGTTLHIQQMAGVTR